MGMVRGLGAAILERFFRLFAFFKVIFNSKMILNAGSPTDATGIKSNIIGVLVPIWQI